MTIDALPTPPNTNDPANFSAKADALLGALPNFVTQANALAVAMNMNSTTDTSTTSDTIATGATTLTVSTGKSFQPGMYLVIADTAAPSTNSMYGQVTSYTSATGALVMNIISILGSGTKTAWVIAQCAPNMDIAGTINGAPNKSTPVAADKFGIWDSVTGLLRYISLTNLVVYFSGLCSAGWAAWTSSLPQNIQSAAYTTLLSDANKHLLHPSADNNPRTFTIDSNANVAYPIGTTITFINQINTLTIAITADTLTWVGSGSTGGRTLAANGLATAIKISATGWVISGTGLA